MSNQEQPLRSRDYQNAGCEFVVLQVSTCPGSIKNPRNHLTHTVPWPTMIGHSYFCESLWKLNSFPKTWIKKWCIHICIPPSDEDLPNDTRFAGVGLADIWQNHIFQHVLQHMSDLWREHHLISFRANKIKHWQKQTSTQPPSLSSYKSNESKHI